MAESLGDAYVDVHARTATFDKEVTTAATKAAKKAETALNKGITRGAVAGGKNASKAMSQVGAAAVKIVDKQNKAINQSTAQRLDRDLAAQKAHARAVNAVTAQGLDRDEAAHARSAKRINRIQAARLDADLKRQESAARAANAITAQRLDQDLDAQKANARRINAITANNLKSQIDAQRELGRITRLQGLVTGGADLRGATGQFGRALRGLGDDFNNLRLAGDTAFSQLRHAGEEVAQALDRDLGRAADLTAGHYHRLSTAVQGAMEDAAKAGNASSTSIANAGARAANRVIDEFARAEDKVGRALRSGAAPGAFRPIFNESDRVARQIEQRFERVGKNLSRSLINGAQLGFAGILAAAAGIGGATAFFGFKEAGNLEQANVQFKNFSEQINGTVGNLASLKTKLDAATAGSAQYNEVLAEISSAQEHATATGAAFTQRLVDIATNTTVGFDALRNTTTQLLALGFSGDAAITTVLNFSNAAAAAGKSGADLNESVEGAVRAMTQLASKGKLTFQDLNQISERLPNVLRQNVFEQLAVELGFASDAAKVTAKDLRSVQDALDSDGGIAAAPALAALLKTVQEVPGAVDAITGITALDKQADTLNGRFEAVRDTVKNELAKAFKTAGQELAKAIDPNRLKPILAETLGGISKPITDSLIKALPEIEKALPGLAKSIGPVFAGILGFVVDALPFIQKMFEFVGKIVEILRGDAVKSFFGAIGGLLKPLLPVFQTLGNVIKAVFPILVGVIKAFEPLVKIVGALLVPVLAVVNLFAKFLQLPLVKNLAILIVSFFAIGGLFAKIAQLFTRTIGIVRGLSESFKALGVVGRLIGIAIDLALAPFRILFSLIRAGAAKFSIFGNIATGVSLVLGRFLGVLRAILEPLAQFGAAVKNLKNIIPGFGFVTDKVSAAVKKVGGWIKKAGGLFHGGGKEVKSAEEKLADLRAEVNRINSLPQPLGPLSASAQFAKDQIDALNVHMDALRANALGLDGTVVNILIKFTQIGLDNAAFLQSKGIPLTGLEDASGFSTEGINAANAANKAIIDQIANQEAVDEARRKAAQQQSNDNAKAAEDAAKKAAEAAKAAAKKWKEAMREIIKDLDKDFKSGLIKGDAENARRTLSDLGKRIVEAFAENGKKAPSKLLNRLAEDSKKLQKLITQRDKIVARLEAASAARSSSIENTLGFAGLDGITSQLKALNDELTNTETKVTDLTRLRILRSGVNVVAAALGDDDALKKSELTGKNIQRILNERLQAIRTFNQNIQTLVSKGLDKSLLQQLISGGVEGSGATAAALASASRGTINAINKTQEQINDTAKKLGSIAGDVAATIGENVVLGIVNGLKTQKKELVKEITSLVDLIIKRVKEGLEVKSPSRVMARIGRFAAMGLANGMMKGSSHVAKAAAGLAKSAQPSAKSMTFGGSVQAAALRQARAQGGAVGGGTVTNNTRSTVVQAPVTQIFNQSSHDPNAVYAAFSKSVARGVR